MVRATRWWVLAASLCPAVLLAASAVMTDYETHFVRGLAQRQSAQMELDNLALQKGSTELVKGFAQSDIEVHTEGRDSIIATGKQLDAWGPNGAEPPGPGAMRPGGPPPGAPPPGGGPPGAGPPGAGPPGANIKDLFTDALKSSSGADFDRLYLLVSILQHEEMLRAIDMEIETPSANAQLVTWSKAHQEAFRRQARHLQKLLRGEGDGVDNPLEREIGTATPPPRSAPPRSN